MKRIAEAHGGFVRVRSRVGVGTTFHLLLPTSACRVMADGEAEMAA